MRGREKIRTDEPCCLLVFVGKKKEALISSSVEEDDLLLRSSKKVKNGDSVLNESDWPTLGSAGKKDWVSGPSFAEKLQGIRGDGKKEGRAEDVAALTDDSMSDDEPEEVEDCEPLCVIREDPNRNFPSFSFSEKMKRRLYKAWDKAVIVKLLGRNIGYKGSGTSTVERQRLVKDVRRWKVQSEGDINVVQDPALQGMVLDSPLERDLGLVVFTSLPHDPGEVDRGIELQGKFWADSVDPDIELVDETPLEAMGIEASFDGGGMKFPLSAIYALPNDRDKGSLWDELGSVASSISTAWAVLGDFNDILFSTERTGGSRPNESDFLVIVFSGVSWKI
ncbi:hypothetical protein K1719_013197 [Acacia pycnantha]|nr:hypothetical protein K1719_013197 [Acacia pycnantha]